VRPPPPLLTRPRAPDTRARFATRSTLRPAAAAPTPRRRPRVARARGPLRV